ncbi:cell division protein Cdv3 [Thermosynechococcus sp. NK55a]|uniref:ATP synthase F0 subunit B n=1 Tax=unclassified Thermosynechococcus TaxID=2622553 RepID=UPI0003D91FB0|nr:MULTISPECIES: ATP synthase F0 subunit B [unclassified Thermosynechococcus]AHB88036.1 cell division protein Cdv3 [Thermosynechococcus sp. NK55a]
MLYSNTNPISTTAGVKEALDVPAPALQLLQQLQKLEELLILEGTKIPLTGRKLIDEEQLLNQLAHIEQAIPESVKAAQQILNQRDKIIERAQHRAQEILRAAEQRAAQITDELRIRQQAELEAQKIRQQVQQEVELMRQRALEEINLLRQNTEKELAHLRQLTRHECQERQQEADAYADRTLAAMERQLKEMLAVIQNGRQYLKQHQAHH